ncbi:MAG: hypothetical protein ALECFALPRED_005020 [Alectoria fallacina]|uniref:Uncharacterized protein n=1 Tax=Alectoria fallacina TaxID=1903189 RepID=A0A8H3ITJ5_9LECA|nr:MAG: hypothetical protein ALECFALPRED_005020 [Alectoria fallacina]
MKLSILSSVAAVVIIGSIAFPAPFPNSNHVPVSQGPSPPSSFPAGRIVEVKDSSPPQPFPKYPLVEGNPLEDRNPSTLSRFPTDGESKVQDSSPPKPFAAGRVVEAKNLSRPLEERDPSAPHMVVEIYPVNPSPPRPFPKDPLDGGHPLEESNPFSRFPADGEMEATETLKLFPTGRVTEVQNSSMPFPAGRAAGVKNSSSSNTIESRSPSPILRATEGSEAEANDPSPPRPFLARHPVDIFPRALRPHWCHYEHGGCWPPSSPPVPAPTAPAHASSTPTASTSTTTSHLVTLLTRVQPRASYTLTSTASPSTSTTATIKTSQLIDILTRISPYASSTSTASTSTTTSQEREEDYPASASIPLDNVFTVPMGTHIPTLTFFSVPIATRRPRPSRPTPTASSPNSSSTSTTTTDYNSTKPRPSSSEPCTTTVTQHRFFLRSHPTSTVYSTTVTVPRPIECRGCELAVTTVHVGKGLHHVGAATRTVTEEGTTTVHQASCVPSSSTGN